MPRLKKNRVVFGFHSRIINFTQNKNPACGAYCQNYFIPNEKNYDNTKGPQVVCAMGSREFDIIIINIPLLYRIICFSQLFARLPDLKK